MRPEIAYYDFERVAEISAEESLFVLRLKANEDAAYDELVRNYHARFFMWHSGCSGIPEMPLMSFRKSF